MWSSTILDGSRACHFEHWGKGYFFVGRATAGSDGRGGVGASAKVALLMSHQNSSRSSYLEFLTSWFTRSNLVTPKCTTHWTTHRKIGVVGALTDISLVGINSANLPSCARTMCCWHHANAKQWEAKWLLLTTRQCGALASDWGSRRMEKIEVVGHGEAKVERV